jgi:hypothetical protein
MLESIIDLSVKLSERTNNLLTVKNKNIAFQDSEKVIEDRPVVKTNEPEKPEADTEHKAGGYKSDDEGIFFEKHNEHGDIIVRIPHKNMIIDTLV